METGLSKRILQLASQLNWLLDLGHYDFSSNQLHLTFQLQYQPLTLRELEDCVGSYYEGLCTAYAATVKSIQVCTSRHSMSH